jgi:hypothetical protein
MEDLEARIARPFSLLSALESIRGMRRPLGESYVNSARDF